MRLSLESDDTVITMFADGFFAVSDSFTRSGAGRRRNFFREFRTELLTYKMNIKYFNGKVYGAIPKVTRNLRFNEGCAPRKTKGSLVLWTCETEGPLAKVWSQGPVSAKELPSSILTSFHKPLSEPQITVSSQTTPSYNFPNVWWNPICSCRWWLDM